MGRKEFTMAKVAHCGCSDSAQNRQMAAFWAVLGVLTSVAFIVGVILL